MTDATTTFAEEAVLLFAVQNIVSNVDAVIVTRTVDSLGVLLTLRVAPEDMRTVIGKMGRTVQALRQLVRVAGAKNHLRVNLKVVEPDGSEVRGIGSAETAEHAFDTL